jgi:hypothetical protein
MRFITKQLKEEDDPWDYSLSYDRCIRDKSQGVQPPMCYSNVTRRDDTKKGGRKATKNKGEVELRVSPSVALENENFVPPPRCISDDDGKLFKMPDDIAPCKNFCPKLPTTTYKPTTAPPKPFFKRTFHGGINFVLNFCIMPICVFIARFYKETFNTSTIKGQKAWYWMHLVGAGGSTVLMYIGYFSKTYVTNSEPHVMYGNLYVICLVVAYVSSWTRHKNTKITKYAEIIHGGAGYGCFLLASMCSIS